MIEDLEKEAHDKIVVLSKKGDELFDTGKYGEAIKEYQEGITLLPLPKNKWEAALWLYSAIGDAYFMQKNYEKSLDNFFETHNSYQSQSNPFLNLRIGQCYYEIGNMDKAGDFLLKAYMFEGKKIFKGENKKYFNYINKEFNL